MADRKRGITLTELTVSALVLAILLLGMLLFVLRIEQNARLRLLRQAALRQAEKVLVENRSCPFQSLSTLRSKTFSVSVPHQNRPLRGRMRVTDLKWDGQANQAFWVVAEVMDGENVLVKAGEIRLRDEEDASR